MKSLKRQVLIVEDNDVQAVMIKQFVEEFGCRVIATVDKGEKAVAYARKLNPNLVIMDVFLNGDMTGIEAMQLIRQNAEVPAIYISGNSDRYYVQKARRTGCVDFLFKPLKKNELRKAVAYALEPDNPQRRGNSLFSKMRRSFRSFF